MARHDSAGAARGRRSPPRSLPARLPGAAARPSDMSRPSYHCSGVRFCPTAVRSSTATVPPASRSRGPCGPSERLAHLAGVEDVAELARGQPRQQVVVRLARDIGGGVEGQSAAGDVEGPSGEGGADGSAADMSVADMGISFRPRRQKPDSGRDGTRSTGTARTTNACPCEACLPS